jgi:plasmid stabilization system protein ParE
MARVAEIQFHPEAAAEFDFAVDWYLEHSEQAAGDFLREVNDAVASIAANPQMWTEHVYGTRRFVLRHFPYLIVYLLHETRIEIVAVAHGRRRPGYWGERAKTR